MTKLNISIFSPALLQGDTLAPYIFTIVIDYIMRTTIGEGRAQKTHRKMRSYPLVVPTTTAWHRMLKVWKSSLRERINKRLFVFTVELIPCETWTLTKADENSLLMELTLECSRWHLMLNDKSTGQMRKRMGAFRKVHGKLLKGVRISWPLCALP